MLRLAAFLDQASGHVIAKALVGLGLSIVAMIIAAFGLLPPVAGAFPLEVIDIAMILNAIRASR
ncbi:putative silver efflux P-type ATPase domain protein [Brucella lupini]|uniref:Putative silver efflux P-type ATPase domain protein n=1 Tax=Brucella lupini TaxID=255457 RepID=A0A256GGL0_9HYPH|nr:putative silver efflux P-type ATPase domain protein [Brucella lupini]